MAEWHKQILLINLHLTQMHLFMNFNMIGIYLKLCQIRNKYVPSHQHYFLHFLATATKIAHFSWAIDLGNNRVPLPK